MRETKIRCVVACRDAGGTPTFYPIEFVCSTEAYENGDHYLVAQEMAREDGYESVGIVYDENDGPAWLFRHMFGEAVHDCR